jgi:hypothetical protein
VIFIGVAVEIMLETFAAHRRGGYRLHGSHPTLGDERGDC